MAPRTIVSSESYSAADVAAALASVGNMNDFANVVSRRVSIDPELIGGDYWTTMTPDIARRGAMSFCINGYGYVFGGIDNGGLFINTLTQYNDSANTWATISFSGTSQIKTDGNVGGIFHLNGLGYTVGGFGAGSACLSELIKYNDSLTSVTTMTADSYGVRGNTMVFIISGYSYNCGGYIGGSDYISSTTSFNDSTNAWAAKTADLVGKRQGGGFSLNGFGYSYSSSITSGSSCICQYGDSTNAWVQKTSPPVVEYHVGACNLNNLGYTWGGITPNNYNYQYNDGLNIWSTKNVMLTAKYRYSSLALNGFGYACDGYTSSNTNEVVQYRDHTIYKISDFYRSSTKTPKQISITTTINNKRYSLPIQIRSTQATNELSNWILAESNKDVIKKNGQILADVLAANASGYRQYELRVGLPKFFAGVGSFYWSTKKANGTARYGLSGMSLGGYAYVCNGGTASTSNLSNVDKYSDSLDTWTAKATGGTARQYVTSFSLNGLGYIIDGCTVSPGTNTNEVNQYNDLSNAWTTISPAGGTARNGLGGYSLNGFGYSTSGYIAAAASTVEQFNDALKTWASKAITGTTARYYVGAFSLNGYGYQCSGFTTVVVSTVEQYNDTVLAMVAKTGGGTARKGVSAFSIVPFGYISNGYAAAVSAETNQYNDATNLWYIKTSNLTARYDAAGISLNGMGYVCCGNTGSVSAVCEQLYSNENFIDLSVIMQIFEE